MKKVAKISQAIDVAGIENLARELAALRPRGMPPPALMTPAIDSRRRLPRCFFFSQKQTLRVVREAARFRK